MRDTAGLGFLVDEQTTVAIPSHSPGSETTASHVACRLFALARLRRDDSTRLGANTASAFTNTALGRASKKVGGWKTKAPPLLSSGETTAGERVMEERVGAKIKKMGLIVQQAPVATSALRDAIGSCSRGYTQGSRQATFRAEVR